MLLSNICDGSDKPTSLLHPSINYNRKKFCCTGPMRFRLVGLDMFVNAGKKVSLFKNLGDFFGARSFLQPVILVEQHNFVVCFK